MLQFGFRGGAEGEEEEEKETETMLKDWRSRSGDISRNQEFSHAN